MGTTSSPFKTTDTQGAKLPGNDQSLASVSEDDDGFKRTSLWKNQGVGAVTVAKELSLKAQRTLNLPAKYFDCSTCNVREQGRVSKVASLSCHVCNVNFCGACPTKHRSVTNEKHFVSPILLLTKEPGNQVATKNGNYSLICRDGHRDKPRYFCETCKDIVCLECIENHHRKHNFFVAKDAYLKHRTLLEQQIKLAQCEAFRTSKQFEHEDIMLNDLRAEKEDVRKKIKSHTALLMESLRKQEEQLLRDLDRMFTKKEEMVGRNKKRIQNRLELINRTCRFTDKALKDAGELQVLVFKNYAMKRLEEVCQSDILTTGTEDLNLSYFFSKRSVDQAKMLLGQLVDTNIDPCHCVADGQGLVRAVVGREAFFIVTTKDKKDMPLTTGGADVQVLVSSSQEGHILSHVFDQGNGQYTVTYIAKLSGLVTISVRIYDQPIKDSEFNVEVICQRDYQNITAPLLTIGGLYHSSVGTSFKLPCGVAVDEKGRLFIADCHNHCIKIVSRTGKLIKSFGSFGTKNGQLSNPTDVAITQGKIFVCDKDNNRVQCFTPDGVFLSKFCHGCCGLKRPWGLCVDKKGNVVVVDTKNNKIQVFSEDGNFVKSFGAEGSRNGEFLQPYFAAVHKNGNIYVTDNGNDRVQVFDESYSYKFNFGSRDGELSLKNPTGITMDYQDNVIVADQCNSRLQVFRQDGRRLAVISESLNHLLCQSYPKGLAITQDGYIVVADSDNDRIILL